MEDWEGLQQHLCFRTHVGAFDCVGLVVGQRTMSKLQTVQAFLVEERDEVKVFQNALSVQYQHIRLATSRDLTTNNFLSEDVLQSLLWI